MNTNNKNTWQKPLLYILFWIVFGLYFTSEVYIYYTHNSEPYSFYFIALLIMPEAIIWAVLGVGVIKLAHKFPLSNKPWYKNASLHLLAGVGFALLHSVFHAYLAGLIGVCQQMLYFAGRPFDFAEHFIFNLVLRFHRNVITYFAIVSVVEGIQYYKRYRERELLASKLETQLIEARLQTLKLQLQPHFLFNTMHTITSLIQTKPVVAQKMIVRLSELLRLTLNNANEQVHTLEDEMKILEKYLEIESIRFEDKLTVLIDIEPSTKNLMMPGLILQPVVENAIKHGIEKSAEPGTVEISSHRSNGSMIIRIKNSGGTINNESTLGIGLSSAQSRLNYLYGDKASIQLIKQNGGSLAELSIPI